MTSALSRLPVRPSMGGDDVREAYVSELKNVATPDELRAFVLRWQPLYELRTYDRPFDKKEKGAKSFRLSQKYADLLKTGEINYERTLDCIQKCRTNACAHIMQYSCAGANIIAPLQLLEADQIGEKYQCGSDIALIQRNGGMGALDNI